MSLLQIDPFDSDIFVKNEYRPSGTYSFVGEVRAPAFISTVFVRFMDVGASVKVNYYDSTTGADVGERYDLKGHDVITAPNADRILVTRCHNRVTCEVIVSGGGAEFSVYVLAVSSTDVIDLIETNLAGNPAIRAVSELHDSSGAELGTSSNPIYTTGNSELLSPLPGFIARSAKVLAAGVTSYSTYTMTKNIALIDFHFGGRGAGQSELFRLVPSATQFIPSGNFETNADVSAWSNTGIGSSLGISWVRNTTQFVTGLSSVSHTFVQSDVNNYPEISYTWATPQDFNAWRYITASVRVTVAAGGNQTRTVSMILEDVNGATRTYSIAGTTTTAPFNVEQWLNIVSEIENPTSSSGTFDNYNVKRIRLRLQDGGNKTGTIYWDNIHFDGSQSLIERIYIEANRTFQLVLNPAELFDTGETLAVRFRNNDNASKEYTVTAKGVER